MKIVGNTDWKTVDDLEFAGDHITMPDGSQHYIEMEYIQWYWLEFMMVRGHTTQSIAQDTLDTIMEIDSTTKETGDFTGFNDIFRCGIMGYAKERVAREIERGLHPGLKVDDIKGVV